MAFAAKIDALRKGFADPSTAVRTVRSVRDLFGSIPKQLEREKAAVYLFRELLELFGGLSDGDRVQRDALAEAMTALVDQCPEAEDSIRYYFVVRTYNLMVKMIGKEKNRYMMIQSCALISHCPAKDEHLDLLYRLCKVVLKVVCDVHARTASSRSSEEQQAISAGWEFICGTSVRLVEEWSSSSEPEVRAKSITIFREVFNNSTAYLYRLFTMDESRAGRFFRSVVDLFRRGGKFTEHEMVDLFQQSLTFLESIYSLGEASKPYLKFTDILESFERIEGKPAADYLRVLRSYLKFQNSNLPDVDSVTVISDQLRDLSGTYSSDPLLVDVAVFMTMQLRIHLDQMKQRAVTMAPAIIDLCKTLTKLVKNCPRDRAQICAQCGSSGRHLIDYISTIVIQMGMMLSKAGQDISPELVLLINGFLRHKLLTLDDLSCGKKQSLLDSALRFVGNWIRAGAQLVKGREFSELVRLLVDFKYRYGFEFLAPSYLIRLVETCLKDCGTCQEVIDVRLIRLLLVLRGEFTERDQTKEIDETVYTIMSNQLSGKDDTIRAMNVVQLMERPELEKFGFPLDATLNQQEKITILLAEINWASRYKNSSVIDYFNELHRLNADPALLGMTIYLLQDSGISQLPEATLEALKVKLQNARPKLPIDQIRRHGALAALNYYQFGALSKAIIAKLKNTQINRDTFKNDQINEVLRENIMEKELLILAPLEQTYQHFRDMVIALADTSFQHFGVIYSLGLVSSMLDNTGRFFQISYFPRRSVEMQLFNYTLVSQKPDRPLDLCCSLGYLLENHQTYKQLLDDTLYQKPWVPSLPTLAAKANEILTSIPPETVSKANDSRKYHFMNLRLGLALYQASRDNLPSSINHLQQLNHALKTQNSSIVASLIRGRLYHTLFRLVANHHLPPPHGLPLRIFIRLMLEHYNDIQKLTTDLGFLVCTSTVDMTVDTLRHQVYQYDTDRIEPNVEQILRFVLRRGAGLRAMQLLAMYGMTCADAEKEDKCQMLLTYLDRLLMFRPLKADQKPDCGDSLAVPVISLLETPDGSDPTRKAAKYIKSPSKRSPSPKMFSDEPLEWRQYVVHHHAGCSCQFCRFPQYKCQALLAGLTYGRLSFLKDRTEQCLQFYGGVSKHWDFAKKLYENPALVGQKDEFVSLLGRAFMQYGQFLTKQGQVENARREFDKSLKMVRGCAGCENLGLVADVELNIKSIADREAVVEETTARNHLPAFAEFKAANPQFKEASPKIDLGKMFLGTPKVGPSRVIPKTASRADDLLKQVARKRLKTALAKDYCQETELINAISNLSCATERKPNSVSIFVDSPQKPTIKLNNRKKLFSKETYSSEQSISPDEKPTRKKQSSETPVAAPRLPRTVNPYKLQSSSSSESFKDILVNGLHCSTPKCPTITTRTRARTTCKKPKLVNEYPKLATPKTTKSPEATQNNSPFNSSFRDVLLKSISESAAKPKRPLNGSVIILDDSSTDERDDVINSSVTETQSLNATGEGVLSLKKYSDRKVYGSSRKMLPAKTRLQFDGSIVDITTPTGTPAVTPVHTPAPPVEVTTAAKRARGRPRAAKATVDSAAEKISTVATRKKVRAKNGAA